MMHFINLVVLILYVFSFVNCVPSSVVPNDHGSDQSEEYQYLDSNSIEDLYYDASEILVTNSSNPENDQPTRDWSLGPNSEETQKETREPVSEQQNYDEKQDDYKNMLFEGDKEKSGQRKQKYFLIPYHITPNYRTIYDDEDEDEHMPDGEEADSDFRSNPMEKPHQLHDYRDELTPLTENKNKSSIKPNQLPSVWNSTSPEWYEIIPDSRFDQDTDLVPDSTPLPESEHKPSIKPDPIPSEWDSTTSETWYLTTPDSRFDQDTDLVPDSTPLPESEYKPSIKPDPIPSVRDSTSSETWYRTTPDSRFDQNTDSLSWAKYFKPTKKPEERPNVHYETTHNRRLNDSTEQWSESVSKPSYGEIPDSKPNYWPNTPPSWFETVTEHITDSPDTIPETWPGHRWPDSSHRTEPGKNSDVIPKYIWTLQPVYWHDSKPGYWHENSPDQNTDMHPDFGSRPCQDSDSRRRPFFPCKTRPKYRPNHFRCRTRPSYRPRHECSSEFQHHIPRPVYRPRTRPGYLPWYIRPKYGYRPRYSSRWHKHSWCYSRRNRKHYPCYWRKTHTRRWHHHRS